MFRRDFGRAVLAGLLATVSCSAPALAADFPARPIKLVVPFAAGGSTDIVARLVAEYAGRELKQTIVVENKAGAGGSLGMEQVARATPDGYTIGMATMSTHGSNPAVFRKLNYDPVKDFAPIANVLAVPSIFAINPGVPAQDMQAFVALAKAQPEKYSFASPGIGSLGHVNIENFMMLADMRLLHVPYRGAGPALNDVMGGQVDAITDNLSSTLPQVRGGKLRALAVLGLERSPLLPDVPTYKELGYPEMGTGGWFGLVAPAGTPPTVIERLNAAVRAAMNDAEFRRKAEEVGGTLMPTTPQEFQQQIDEALARYAKVAKAADIQAD
ncbi:Bug family tripartite tricarboxylate transporter substrate binding protein [Bordetella genomosp. 6]|uniref:Bug family tripartite tricarboxylate transporter substrate binding protein n=1 Tax=Bordetella TaxID=517 RepID=UPI00092725A2|nr:tripartite tricarboxylate transporter substrate binding protein BugE [Bordetella genomosp. 6]ARP76255.1 ABC transporter substrate-binding protein [Bordetella genomosp. 6]SHT14994.1 periplasmic solute-binding protein [Mycobacteroides abscessus subsp. abscessus]